MSLSSYLAEKYLNGDPSSLNPSRPKKKRKKNHTSEPASGLVIADDDLSISHTSNPLLNDTEQDGGPVMYHPDSRQGRSAEFRKKKSNGWKTISEGGTSTGDPSLSKVAPIASRSRANDTNGDDEAEKIIRAAALEQEAHRLADEEGDAPAIVDMPEDDETRPRMADGSHAGLQTAAQTRALEEARLAQEQSEGALESRRKKKKHKEDREAQESETVYRDATGRRIDIHMKRAEARKAEEAARKKEQEEKVKMGGDVQRREREERKQKVDEAKFLGVARYEDDEDMNQELKNRERWGDTMASYIGKESGSKAKVGGGATTTSSRPTYKGASQPNRYGIRPGHRWDGVDRGNGFEKEWFQARSRKDRNRDLEYQWQMDE